MSSRAIFTAADAQQIRLDKRSISHETYKLIFEQSLQRIKLRAEMNETNTRFRVPNYIMGRPLFDTKHAARYVSEKLRIHGYETEFVLLDGSYFVDICWKSTPKPKIKSNVQKVIPKREDKTKDLSNSNDAIRRMEMIRLALKNANSKQRRM